MSDDSNRDKLDLVHSITAVVDQAFEDIKAQMKRLRLDSGNVRYRNPLDLLEEAYLAIRYPASAQGAAPSPLLILRGCIDRSIEELVRRCPAQKQAESRRDRILALGLHCGRSGLPVAHFDSLAADDESVNRELSSKETRTLERPELAKLFTRGAQFLRTLLISLDDALLRP